MSTEQHMLCMIWFNTTVCLPHWCILVMMEMPQFNLGRGDAMRRGGHRCSHGDGNKDDDNGVGGGAWRWEGRATLPQ